MRSSYIQNDYRDVFIQNIITWRPTRLVELGVLDGYSTLAIAKGLAESDRLYGYPNVKLDAYDLFEDYPYKHGKQEEVQKLIDEAGLTKWVNLQKGDAWKVQDNYDDNYIEFLHVDVSNTGDTVKKVMELWHPKMRMRGMIYLEGGTEERDQVEWMRKYNMPSIKQEINTNPIIQEYYLYGTYFKFPGLTVLLRRWGGRFDTK